MKVLDEWDSIWSVRLAIEIKQKTIIEKSQYEKIGKNINASTRLHH